ncbi:MAG: hypothetical protein ACFFB0_12115 [Promethearchaeota archaeon]
MKRLKVPKPISCGLILSYKCNCECKHCMYFGSPKWADSISNKQLKETLTKLSKIIQPSPDGPENVRLNYGLHFTGGEPFLDYNLLLKAVEFGNKLNIPSMFVETNCYWCKNDTITRDRLLKLKNIGLHGILISVNPFILEFVPFEYTKRAIRISLEIFRENLMIYQLYYFGQFRELNFKGRLPIEKYIEFVSIEDLKRRVEMLMMGRAAYSLENLHKKFPIEHFLNENCKIELVRNWHCHFDNYGNYMPGYCGGISWGNIRNLDSLFNEGIDLDEYPILKALILRTIKDLYIFSIDHFNYEKLNDGYVSKCHVCFDIRRAIVSKTNEFKELSPLEFYSHI